MKNKTTWRGLTQEVVNKKEHVLRNLAARKVSGPSTYAVVKQNVIPEGFYRESSTHVVIK